MKREYSSPKLVEYGTVNQLTLGIGGDIPDVDDDGDVVGNCQSQFPGHTDCHVESGAL